MNLSNGIDDGIVLLYAKDGELYPVGLTKDQYSYLDTIIGTLPGKLKVFGDCPQGKLDKIN